MVDQKSERWQYGESQLLTARNDSWKGICYESQNDYKTGLFDYIQNLSHLTMRCHLKYLLYFIRYDYSFYWSCIRANIHPPVAVSA